MVDKAEVEAFLFLEARLADENRYEEWGDLWTDDAIYWVPSNDYDYDPLHHVSIIYDDRNRIQDRIDRLKSGSAWAQQPQSRLCRVISNVEVEVKPDGDIEVRSKFTLGEIRRGRQATYFASQLHTLRQTNDGLRMASKKVMLINNDEPINNLSFLI